MDAAAGAVMPLLERLGKLVVAECTLEARMKKGVERVLRELEVMHTALHKVGKVPPDQLDEQVGIWADNVRELSYRMEDAVDTFIVRVEDGHDPGSTNMKNRVKKFLKKTAKLFRKGKVLHQVSDAIGEATQLAKEWGDLRERYRLEWQANSPIDTIDPRLKAVYKDITELVGIEDTRDALIKKLSDRDESSKQQLKTMCIVGSGGLGKTTLAKAVYDKIKVQFDYGAFVSVSRDPNMKKIFKKILYQLDKEKFAAINKDDMDLDQLIDDLISFLKNKRYLIVIDDIWDEAVWGIISCAFSKSNLGSIVITTTRKLSVSKECCSSADMEHKMKRLSDDDSEKLFYKRIFTQRSDCPHELEQVSRKILKKCGGVPLAITTIASLLASNDQQIKPKYQWDNLLSSIGRGLEEDDNVKDMQRILSFSYYDLPPHLKPCLLYLSIFPEDYQIMRDRLIWRWIAEGLVIRGKGETRSLYELGVGYFHELINRSLIQPLDSDVEDRTKACHVHDIVLDLIRSLSAKEIFVTVLDGTEGSTPSSQGNVRRVSFQNNPSRVDTIIMSQVRSVAFFRTDFDVIQSLSRFQVLRVLDLQGCFLRSRQQKADFIRHVRNLLHLRYLGLRNTDVTELPRDIGKLRFLQTLDLRTGRWEEPRKEERSSIVVPLSIIQLRDLMCLHLDMTMKMPAGIGNLVLLEVLTGLHLSSFSAIGKELLQLVELRVLELVWEGENESECNSLVMSLHSLCKLQSLMIDNYGDARFDVNWDSWVPPPHLRTLVFWRNTSTLSPRWINSSCLPILSTLDIEVDRVQPAVDICILGKLPTLRSLRLATTEFQYTCVAEFIVGADAFPCLEVCSFSNFLTGPSMFPRGAMPRLEFLEFYARALDIASGELDVAMGHLPSLNRLKVNFWVERGTSSKSDEAEAVLGLAANTHHNRPTLDVRSSYNDTKVHRDTETETDTSNQRMTPYPAYYIAYYPPRPRMRRVHRTPGSDDEFIVDEDEVNACTIV